MTLDIPPLTGDDLGPGSPNRARVDEVRRLAQAATTQVPFLLIPVRLETRFVQAEVPTGATQGTVGLTKQLLVAVTAAESLARRNYATPMTGRTAKQRREFKSTVEQQTVDAALGEIVTIKAALAAATPSLRDVDPATAEELRAYERAIARLRSALRRGETALAAARSPYHRDRLLAAFAPVHKEATGFLAESNALVRPAADLLRELRAARHETGRGEGREPLVVGKARLVESARAHAQLTADLDEIANLTEPTATASKVDDAIARTGGIVVVPTAWKQELLRRVDDLAAGVAPVARLERLRDLVSRLRTDDPGHGVAVAPTPTKLVDQLRVRIFPDDFSINTHEAALTAGERDAGRDHWREVAAGGADEPARRAAWRGLCARFGSTRAAWVARQTRPAVRIVAAADVAAVLSGLTALRSMLEQFISAPGRALTDDLYQAIVNATPAARSIPDTGLRRIRELGEQADNQLTALLAARTGDWNRVGQAQAGLRAALAGLTARPADALAGEPTIDDAQLRAAAWTQPPRAGALPHRFVVVTVSGGQVSHVVAGADVPVDLALGLDPREERAADERPHVDANGTLVVGASIRWMVDYDTAVAKGMGITVPITPQEAATGFQRVYVLGLTAAATPEAAATQLAELLDGHHYAPRGLALLPVATPTNNSDTATSGYHKRDDPERSFDVEQGAALAIGGADPSDGSRLARGLGVAEEVFAHVAEADRYDIGDALVANTALWPATAGYALEELLGSVIGLDARDRLRDFATRGVLGRGGMPSLRVGAQPYGVLATTALSRFTPAGGNTMPAGPPAGLAPADRQRRFEILLRDVLLTMRRDWADLIADKVEHAYSSQPADPQHRVLSILGLDATAGGYAQRFAVNTGRRGTGVGPIKLHIGLPADPESTVAHEGAFAVVQRFADVIAKAGGFTRGPLVARGVVAPPFDKTFDRLESSRGYEVRYLDLTVPLGGSIGSDDLAALVNGLLSRSLEQLAREASTVESGRPLLYLLLRQALLVQARDVALRMLELEGVLTPDLRARVGSGELFALSGLGARKRRITRWSFLLARLSPFDGALGPRFPSGPGTLLAHLTAGTERRMDDFLNNRGDNPFAQSFNGIHAYDHRALMGPLRTHADAVRRLGQLPGPRAERVTVEHLDTCSHRLDAWLLGLAVDRLTTLRAARPTGVHLGAFGWVEDLTPQPSPTPVAGVPAPLNTDPRTPIYPSRAADGFIHAPSPNHAATAALLRAGYLAAGGSGVGGNGMAVNISSRRVRAALAVLDGIGTGNDLGALLGYQFERDLHDAADHTPGVFLDYLIAPLRRRFPSVVGLDDSAASAAIGDRHVVDGLRLLTTVQASLSAHAAATPGSPIGEVMRAGTSTLYPYGLVDEAGSSLLPPTGRPDLLNPVLLALDRMADTIDALGDLVLTEGMHQIVQGNHPRAAAVLSALGEGRAPARPEVIDTPAVGTLVSHRVLVQLRPGAGLPAGWTAASARAAAEPALNHWLGELIGPPGQTRAKVEDSDGVHVADVSLTALRVQPIDLMAMLHNGLDGGLPELTVRVLDTLRPIDVRDNEPAPQLRLSLQRHPDWPDHIRSLADTAALLETVAVMLGRARAATSADYVLTETVNAAGAAADAAELATRISGAVDALEALGVRLLGLLSDGIDSDPALLAGDMAAYLAARAGVYRGGDDSRLLRLDALWERRQDFREALLAALGFGISGIVLPTRWVSRDQVASAWLDAAETALLEVTARLRAAGEASGAGVEALLATARAVFTDTMTVLPWFHPSNPGQLDEALLAQVSAEPAVVASRWLSGAATVREGVAALVTATTLADAFGQDTPIAVPIQLPVRAGEGWVGEVAPDGPGSRLSLVLFDSPLLVTDGGPCVALRVDAWDEVIPASSLTTGVSFNYDQPDSSAPQCLLLAVPPRQGGHWEWEDLVQTLHDTLELAKLRAVEPEHVQDDLYGQLLPALIGDIAPYSEFGSTVGPGLADHRVVLDFGAVQPPVT